jgi:hypothetical protein
MFKKGIEHDQEIICFESVIVAPRISFLSEATIRRALALITVLSLFIILPVFPRLPLLCFYRNWRFTIIVVLLFVVADSEWRVEVVCLLGIVLFWRIRVETFANGLFLAVLWVCVT